jgi:hypothetical protein
MKHLLGRVDSAVFLSTNSLADLIASVMARVLRRVLGHDL